jgi:hypothetical protein
MPAIPAFAAVFAIAGAGAAIGTAASIATIGFAVVGAVGATIGAVGAITKNKTLQMIGLGLGVVGGIGGIASSAGVFGDVGIFAPGGTAATDAASTVGADTGATFADSLTPATTGATGAGAGIVDFGCFTMPATAALGEPDLAAQAAWSPGAANTASLDMAPNAADATNQISASAVADTNNATVADKPGVVSGATADANSPAPAVTDKTGLITPDNPTGGVLPQTPPDTAPPPQTPAAWQTGGGKWTPGVNDASGTYSTGDASTWLGRQFDGITSWAKDNQALASGLVTGGFGLLKNLGPTADSVANANNATAQANLALAKLRDQQLANIAAPKAVAYSPPVGSVPSVGNPAAGLAGLINRAPTSAVTGATA